jgi:hypothetical protein
MTTGPRCGVCDTPLIEAGGGWSCSEMDCERYGIVQFRIWDDGIPSWQDETRLEDE